MKSRRHNGRNCNRRDATIKIQRKITFLFLVGLFVGGIAICPSFMESPVSQVKRKELQARAQKILSQQVSRSEDAFIKRRALALSLAISFGNFQTAQNLIGDLEERIGRKVQ